jgi:hypothetical protein
MAISGLCAATIGFCSLERPEIVISVAIIWGVAVVADSAQFSAAAAELTEPGLLGTVLTLQTCLGFLITVIAIQLMPVAVNWLTWRFAFALLSIGPAIGVVAMLWLRQVPEARRMANGAR